MKPTSDGPVHGSGGPASVYTEGAPDVDIGLFSLGVPTLGICYGMQLMARDLGGAVERTGASEFGKAELHTEDSELFHDLPPEQTGMSHRDSVTVPPAGASRVPSVSVTSEASASRGLPRPRRPAAGALGLGGGCSPCMLTLTMPSRCSPSTATR